MQSHSWFCSHRGTTFGVKLKKKESELNPSRLSCEVYVLLFLYPLFFIPTILSRFWPPLPKTHSMVLDLIQNNHLRIYILQKTLNILQDNNKNFALIVEIKLIMKKQWQANADLPQQISK